MGSIFPGYGIYCWLWFGFFKLRLRTYAKKCAKCLLSRLRSTSEVHPLPTFKFTYPNARSYENIISLTREMHTTIHNQQIKFSTFESKVERKLVAFESALSKFEATLAT